MTTQGRRRARRKGAAAVEFAVVAPVFVAIVLGVAETSYLFDVQNQLATAAREGARLAGMDRSGMLQGQTTNDKITADIQNYLTANGLPGHQAEVLIVDPSDHTTPVCLDDPAQHLKLFELRVEVPYASLNGLCSSSSELKLSAKIVFRNAQSTIVQ